MLQSSDGLVSHHRREFGQANRLDLFRQGIAFLTGVDNERLLWLQVFAREMESFFQSWRQPAFDFNRPAFAAGILQQEVDFSSGGGSVKAGVRAGRCGAQKILDHEGFPARTDDWMACQRIVVGNSK